MPASVRALPTLRALATPDEGRGHPVPPRHRRLQPGDDLRAAPGMRPCRRSLPEDVLHGPAMFNQEPESGVDALAQEPGHEVAALVPGQVVPDQDQPDRRQRLVGALIQPGRPAARRRQLGLGQGRGRGQAQKGESFRVAHTIRTRSGHSAALCGAKGRPRPPYVVAGAICGARESVGALGLEPRTR